jgi:hypothetical protein
MQSKFKTKCPECGEFIQIGMEIVKTENSLWVHEHCLRHDDNDDYLTDPLIPSVTKPIPRSIIHSKLDSDKPKKCVNCGNKSFLKKRINTITLDDGERFTTRIYTCDKCFFIMRFVETGSP